MPYQHSGAVNSGGCPSNQCIITFPVVPAGKRLIVTSVSAQLGPIAGPIVVEGTSASYFVPKADPSIGYIAAPVTIYFDPVRCGSSWQKSVSAISERCRSTAR